MIKPGVIHDYTDHAANSATSTAWNPTTLPFNFSYAATDRDTRSRLKGQQEPIESFLNQTLQSSQTFRSAMAAATGNGAQPITIEYNSKLGVAASSLNSQHVIEINPEKLSKLGDLENSIVFELFNQPHNPE